LLKNWKCSIFSFFSSASEKKRKKRITFKKEGRKRIFIAKEEKEEKEEEWVASEANKQTHYNLILIRSLSRLLEKC